MRIVDLQGLAGGDHRRSVAAIGNFDGVHRGHLRVIEAARRLAKRDRSPLSVVTFEPHPREFFDPQSPAFRLTNAETRARRLELMGVEILFQLRFDAWLANLDAERFAEDMLVTRLGIRHAVVGADFRYGRNRLGDAKTLVEQGKRLCFGTEIVGIENDEGKELSSTAVRQALSDGDVAEAARILGHWHRVEGRVEHGQRRGREMGVPTANLSLDGIHRPRSGVYAVLVDILSGAQAGRYGGCASIGTRPTFGDNPVNLEVFLLDFDGDLYGAMISVALVAWQRAELVFDSQSDLTMRMQEDIREARARLAALSLVTDRSTSR